MGLKDRIREKSQKNTKREQVHLAETDETVEVRSLSLGLKSQYMEEAFVMTVSETGKTVTTPRLGIFQQRLIEYSTFDPQTGERLFGPDDREVLDGMDSEDATAIVEVAQRLSGMDKGAVKRAEGNSDETANATPVTSSPPVLAEV